MIDRLKLSTNFFTLMRKGTTGCCVSAFATFTPVAFWKGPSVFHPMAIKALVGFLAAALAEVIARGGFVSASFIRV